MLPRNNLKDDEKSVIIRMIELIYDNFRIESTKTSDSSSVSLENSVRTKEEAEFDSEIQTLGNIPPNIINESKLATHLWFWLDDDPSLFAFSSNQTNRIVIVDYKKGQKIADFQGVKIKSNGIFELY